MCAIQSILRVVHSFLKIHRYYCYVIIILEQIRTNLTASIPRNPRLSNPIANQMIGKETTDKIPISSEINKK